MTQSPIKLYNGYLNVAGRFFSKKKCPTHANAYPVNKPYSSHIGWPVVISLNKQIDQTKIQLYLGDVYVAQNGGRHPDYREEQGQAVMNDAEITVRVQLGRGDASTTVWTTDFSHEYVTINADYRS